MPAQASSRLQRHLLAARRPTLWQRPEAIAKYLWYQPERIFALLDEFYPAPQGKTLQPVPTIPYLPPDGYNFGGQLGMMQGIIAAPNGDVWALDFSNDQVIYLPKGDPSKVKFFCRSTNGGPDSPCKLSGPFHLAIDQQDRIWITNALGDTVTRFPASDPNKEEVPRDRRAQWQGDGDREPG